MKRAIGVALIVGALLVVPATADAFQSHYVACEWGASYTLMAKPRACFFTPYSGAAHYQQTPIRNIHWRSWGGREAVGRGTYFYNSGYHAPVRFRLYRQRLWEEGVYAYTRIRGVLYPGCTAVIDGQRYCDPPSRRHH